MKQAARKYSQRSTALEKEAQGFCAAAASGPYCVRSKAVTPTLDEIQSQTFESYVRNILFDTDESSTNSTSSEDDDDDEQQQQTSDTTNVTTICSQITLSSVHHKDKRKNTRWNHGICKVTLPEGWWDQNGIAKDTTARGDEWQPGTPLGDYEVEGPIKQHVSGIGGVYEYSLLELPPTTIADFRNQADKYRIKQLGTAVDDDISDNHCDTLARKFWKRLGPTMEPSMYGADMEGSLFDGDTACGWSLQQLDNCLQLLSVGAGALPGVTTPYLYIGMWASVFCAHTEDMNLLSINYLHAGAPKYWYAIAPEHAKRFESLCESRFVHSHADCPEFLRHKRSLISPAILKKAGIPFETQIQRPGDAIITFPGGYHFGVNLGFNVAEATNFAVPEWVPKGHQAKVCMCRPSSVRINMQRFEDMLRKYEEDTANAEQLGYERLSYKHWTLLEAKRKKHPTLDLVSPDQVVSSNGPAKMQIKHFPDPSLKLPPGMKLEPVGNKSKGIWIEVLKPLASEGRKSTGKSTCRKRKQSQGPGEEWRFAKPTVKRELDLKAKVLCLVPAKLEGRHQDDDEQCFLGEVTEIAEGHVRVHFQGLPKNEDLWMSMNSPKLFLDGGKWEEPPKSRAEKGNQPGLFLYGTTDGELAAKAAATKVGRMT